MQIVSAAKNTDSAPFTFVSIASTSASSFVASDATETLTINLAYKGASPYDISLDNDSIWIVNGQSASDAGEIYVYSVACGTYEFAVRDATGAVIHPGYAQINGCTAELGAFSLNLVGQHYQV